MNLDGIFQEREKLYNDFVLEDININRGRIVNQYDEIMSIMKEPQLLKGVKATYLTNILEFVANHSAYYSDYIDWKNLWDFPVVNKNILRENYELINVSELNGINGTVKKSTSGSTGVPFSIYMDRNKHSRYIADLKWFAATIGCQSHERMVYLHNAHHSYIKDIEIQKKDNFYNLGYTYCDKENIEKLLEEIESIMPLGMIGYTSLFNAMADYFINEQPAKRNYQLRFIVNTSEVITSRTRNALEEYFGCRVYSRYGSEETGVLAQEDGSEYGARFNEASYYLEMLSLDSDKPVEDGEIGRIVITDLFNHAFPLIRYDTGDIGVRKVLSDGRIYLTKIWGRVLDSIYTTDGRLVPGGEATDFLESIVDIRQFQLVQEDTTTFHWYLNSRNRDYDAFVITETRKMLGEDANVIVEYVDDVPCLKSGKCLKTICKIKDYSLS